MKSKLAQMSVRPIGEAWGTRCCPRAAPPGAGTPLWGSGSSPACHSRARQQNGGGPAGWRQGPQGTFVQPAGLPTPHQSTFTIIYLFVHPSIYVTLFLSQSFSFSPSLNLSQSLFSPTPSAFLNPEISLPSPSSISLSASLSPASPLLHSIS